jgi:nucleotide-binding universal stress UspA family protein
VHGHEPAGWESHAQLALISWPLASVRLLGVMNPPTSSFTSLIPPARRAHAAAIRAWRKLERERVGLRIEALLARLRIGTETDFVEAAGADPGRTIAQQAVAWSADLLVVGQDMRPWVERRLTGAIHEHVVAHTSCQVLLIPAVMPAGSPGSHRGAHSSPGASPFGGPQPAAAGGEA